jgi:LPS-assembly lipoprotein
MRVRRLSVALRTLALTLGACLSLSACGFHPLYAPSGATNEQIGHVFVDVIPNRNGQLLRQALQERLDGPGEEEKQYILSVSYNEHYEGISIQSDNVSTRARISGSADWVLRKPGLLGEKVASGTARALDGTNSIAGQFFYGDLQGEAIDRRMGDTMADQIVQQIAAYFRTHPKAT